MQKQERLKTFNNAKYMQNLCAKLKNITDVKKNTDNI